MSKIKTYYHEELLHMRRSTSYRFTLPVIAGAIQDPEGRLRDLIVAVRFDNAVRSQRENWLMARRRFVIEKKYRGPREGNRHRTPQHRAHAVDVYVYDRRDWN